MNYEEKEEFKLKFNRVVIGVVTCFASLAMFALLITGALQGDNPPSDAGIWLSVGIMMGGIFVLLASLYVTDKDREGNL